MNFKLCSCVDNVHFLRKGSKFCLLEMKSYTVTQRARSNSLPLTPQMNQPVSDDATAPDYTDHFTRTTASTQHPTPTGRTLGTNDVHVSGRYLAPVQNESYMGVQAVESTLVAQEVQGTSDEEPNDIIVTGRSPNYATPEVALRGRLFAKCQKSRRLVQKNGRSNVRITKVGHRSYFNEL